MPLGGSRIGDLVRIWKVPDTGAWQGRRDLHPGSVVADGNVRETAAVHSPRCGGSGTVCLQSQGAKSAKGGTVLARKLCENNGKKRAIKREGGEMAAE